MLWAKPQAPLGLGASSLGVTYPTIPKAFYSRRQNGEAMTVTPVAGGKRLGAIPRYT